MKFFDPYCLENVCSRLVKDIFPPFLLYCGDSDTPSLYLNVYILYENCIFCVVRIYNLCFLNDASGVSI